MSPPDTACPLDGGSAAPCEGARLHACRAPRRLYPPDPVWRRREVTTVPWRNPVPRTVPLYRLPELWDNWGTTRG
jgi:hypothetical protein